MEPAIAIDWQDISVWSSDTPQYYFRFDKFRKKSRCMQKLIEDPVVHFGFRIAESRGK
jgi:hypothetical protein